MLRFSERDLSSAGGLAAVLAAGLREELRRPVHMEGKAAPSPTQEDRCSHRWPHGGPQSGLLGSEPEAPARNGPLRQLMLDFGL